MSEMSVPTNLTLNSSGSSLKRSLATISPSFTKRQKPPSTAAQFRFARIWSIRFVMIKV